MRSKSAEFTDGWVGDPSLPVLTLRGKDKDLPFKEGSAMPGVQHKGIAEPQKSSLKMMLLGARETAQRPGAQQGPDFYPCCCDLPRITKCAKETEVPGIARLIQH